MKSSIALPSGIAGLALFSLAALYAPQPAPLNVGPTPISSLPFPINTSGTYCLTQNLTAGPGDDGIIVNVDNVVIDLGGFVLNGAGEDSKGIDARFQDHIVVKNGTIRNWNIMGVDAGDYSSMNGLHVEHPVGTGIRALRYSLITDCTLKGNDTPSPDHFSIILSEHSTAIDCRVVSGPSDFAVALSSFSIARRLHVEGGKTSLVVGFDSRVEACSVTESERTGIDANSGSSVVGCQVRTVTTEPERGIFARIDSEVSGCIVRGPALVGIEGGSFTTISDCKVSGTTGDGIQVMDGGRVVVCMVRNCNTSGGAGAGGIKAGGWARVENSTSARNSGEGIFFTREGGVVNNCDAFQNSLSGVSQNSGGWTRDNWLVNNDANGLVTSGDLHRIQDNVADENQENGIHVQGQDSLVTGNRAANNGVLDFKVPFGNPTGPINQVSGTIGGSQPQANFKTPF